MKEPLPHRAVTFGNLSQVRKLINRLGYRGLWDTRCRDLALKGELLVMDYWRLPAKDQARYWQSAEAQAWAEAAQRILHDVKR